MPSESLADVTQKDWIRACLKLGLRVETKYGKGSHVLVCHPMEGMKYTLQRDLHRLINIKIFNQLKKWGFNEEEILNALR
ncbi:MAG: hypothetical protein AAB337_01725 [Patescibacteria group bacterium]